jgi:hypothetical protein
VLAIAGAKREWTGQFHFERCLGRIFAQHMESFDGKACIASRSDHGRPVSPRSSVFSSDSKPLPSGKSSSGKITWADITDAEWKASKLNWADLSDDLLACCPSAPKVDTDTVSTEPSSTWACVEPNALSGNDASDTEPDMAQDHDTCRPDTVTEVMAAEDMFQTGQDLSDQTYDGVALEIPGPPALGEWAQYEFRPVCPASDAPNWWSSNMYSYPSPVQVGQSDEAEASWIDATSPEYEVASTPFQKARAQAMAAAQTHQYAVSQASWTAAWWWDSEKADSRSACDSAYSQARAAAMLHQKVQGSLSTW